MSQRTNSNGTVTARGGVYSIWKRTGLVCTVQVVAHACQHEPALCEQTRSCPAVRNVCKIPLRWIVGFVVVAVLGVVCSTLLPPPHPFLHSSPCDMSQQVPDSHFVTYNSAGVHLWAEQSASKLVQNKRCIVPNDQNEPIFDCFLSDDGNYLAVALRHSVRIYRQSTPDSGFSTVTYDLPINEAKLVNFSPKSTFVAILATNTPADDKNLKIYSLSTGKLFYGNDSLFKPFWICF